VGEPTWGIVATVDEPPQLVVAFAAHHLALGASEIHLYLDRPDADAQRLLATLAGVRVTVCDDAYWADNPPGRRPPLPMGRQRRNANHAYARTEVDWLLHCDADEFLREAGTIRHRMSAAADSTMFLQLKMLERVRHGEEPVRGIFDGLFRRPGHGFEDWGEEVYGRFARFLQHGLTGHSVGKGLVRTGCDDLRMDVHFPHRPGGEAIHAFDSIDNQILHFDGLTPLHLMLKLARRLDWPGFLEKAKFKGRGAQMRFTNNKRENARAMAEMVAGTQTVSPVQIERLDARGVLDHTRFDPAPAIVAAGLEVDLSVANFDAALRDREAELIGKAGLSA